MSGIFAAIFNTFFIINVGFKVLVITIMIYNSEHTGTSIYYSTDPEVVCNNNFILGGGAVCLFSWMIIHAIWNFYRANGSPRDPSGRSKPVVVAPAVTSPGMQMQQDNHVPELAFIVLTYLFVYSYIYTCSLEHYNI